jgi:predicted lipid-binding transport protein (Tim44 family)
MGRALSSRDDDGSENGSIWKGIGGGLASGALIGAGIGGPWGALFGAIGGAIVGGVSSAIGVSVAGENSDTEQAAITKFANAYEKLSATEKDALFEDKAKFDQFLSDNHIAIDDAELQQSLWDNKSTVEELIKAELELK